jgi:hypothetical protein
MYLLQSASAHIITTVANRKGFDYTSAKPHATIILPKIWKIEPMIDPLLFPINIKMISTIWKVWMNLKKWTSKVMSAYEYAFGSQKRGMPTWNTKKSHPEKFTIFITFSICSLLDIFINHQILKTNYKQCYVFIISKWYFKLMKGIMLQTKSISNTN